jgi:hypothetical protein
MFWVVYFSSLIISIKPDLKIKYYLYLISLNHKNPALVVSG